MERFSVIAVAEQPMESAAALRAVLGWQNFDSLLLPAGRRTNGRPDVKTAAEEQAEAWLRQDSNASLWMEWRVYRHAQQLLLKQRPELP